MTAAFDLVLRQARMLDGTVADVGIRNGRFAAIAPKLAGSAQDRDCLGKLLIGGLHDHHIHLLATAANLQSTDLTGLLDADAIAEALRVKAIGTAPGEWVRATGYDERAAGIPDRWLLDRWVADRPMRIQDRTGALWLLNSAAIALIGPSPWPDAVEVDAQGAPTGRIWRGDAWLRTQIGTKVPQLTHLSHQLASWGITAVTDAGAHNGPEEAGLLSRACRDGTLAQRLTMMGREDLPAGAEYQLGPVKLLFDERDFPDPAALAFRINAARHLGRHVAAHCVTEAELLFYLAALDMAGGARAGDRIEHGSMIAQGLLADIAAATLTVVANPGFLHQRGDRYLAQMDPEDIPNLQRLKTIMDAGITVLSGSDAPYGPVNPWTVIGSAMTRKTRSGIVLGPGEAISSHQALALFSAHHPIKAGEIADCCVVDRDWAAQVGTSVDPAPVELTLIGGTVHHNRTSSRGR